MSVVSIKVPSLETYRMHLVYIYIYIYTHLKTLFVAQNFMIALQSLYLLTMVKIYS